MVNGSRVGRRSCWELLQDSNSTDHFLARANGIVTSLALLSSVELGVHAEGVVDHPPIPERLLRFFNAYIPDSDAEELSLRE